MQKKFRLVFLFLIILVGAGCEEKKPIIPVDTTRESLSAVSSDVFPMQIAVIKAISIAFTKEVYYGEMDGKSVVVAADKNIGLLSFAVPSVSEGPHELKITLEGKDYSVSFNVKASILIKDPDLFINNSLENMVFSDAVLNNIQELFKNVEGNESSMQHINTIKQYYQSVKQTIGGMNKEDKIILASYIASNPDLFSKETDPTTLIDSFSLNKKIADNPELILNEVLKRMEREKYKLFLAAGTGMALASIKPNMASVFGLAIIVKIYKLNNDNIAGLDKALVRFGNLSADDIKLKKKGSMYSFIKDKRYIINVTSLYRYPNRTDLNSNWVCMKNVIVVLDRVDETWNSINNFTNKFGYKLDGSSYHIKNVNNTKSQTNPVPAEYIIIANISNPKVTGQSIVTNIWEVEFSTEETTSQDFTFDLAYKSEAGESVLKFDATLETKYGWYVGKYDLFDLGPLQPKSCVPLLGEKGDVYFYTTPGKVSCFVRNTLLDGSKEMYKLGSSLKFTNTEKSELEFQHGYQEPNTYGVVRLDLGYCKVFEGTKVSSYEYPTYGWAYAHVPNGQGCDPSPGGNLKYEYRIKCLATFVGSKDPAGLSTDQIKKIKEL